MSQCDCVNAGEPRDLIDLFTPLYQACGGRLYRLHVTTNAKAVLMGDGVDVETRLNSFERALATNTTTYFADSIGQRDQIGALTAGDRCYVFDASADSTVKKGPAMYIWLPSRAWKKLYNGDSPIDVTNLYREGGGLASGDDNKMYVDFSLIPADALKRLLAQIIGSDAGLATDANGRLTVDAGAGLAKDANGRLYVNLAALIAANGGLELAGGKLKVRPADFIRASGGLAVGSDGKVYVDFTYLPASQMQGMMAAMLKQNGGLAYDANGRMYVDFSLIPASRMQNIVSAMLQPGGGINKDANGQMYVDFDSMPTDKFNAMLKSLRLPIWLTANKNFYVDGVNGSDTLDEGRGESESKAFRTIQACVDYVTENYNMSRFTADIVVSDGTFEEALTLPDFTRTSGSIRIRSKSGDRSKTVIVSRNLTKNPVTVSGGNYNLYNLTFDQRGEFAILEGAASNTYAAMISVSDSICDVQGCLFRFSPVGDSSPAYYFMYGLMASSGGVLNLRPASVANRYETGFKYEAENLRSYCLHAQEGGQIKLIGTNAESMTAELQTNGLFTVFAHAAGGSISVGSPRLVKPSCSNEAKANGQRYLCQSGGCISGTNGDAKFFPGLNDGGAEAASFSWYN
ncbi:MAG: hypothetical protein NC489_45430 [Ruminococcus flavefaciens]|nr:hypothetical protein [Ruminococcus flavefaciens]